jgi:hypothetical protein
MLRQLSLIPDPADAYFWQFGMTNIDQFESVFKSADKAVFSPSEISIKRGLLVVDIDRPSAEPLLKSAHNVLKSFQASHPIDWQIIDDDDFDSVDDLMKKIEDSGTELICMYRNLKTRATKYPYTLGTFVDVLTQATPHPVLLLPDPEANHPITKNTDRVMAITDHLTGDNRLVSFAAALTEPGGKLFLTHVEDERVLNKFNSTISKIPLLNTETAEQSIRQQLLKEPIDYIASCRKIIQEQGQDITVEAIVTMGHYMNDYRRLLEEHQIDVLVLNTKDEEQLAMHGLAYPLTVELRERPLMLL